MSTCIALSHKNTSSYCVYYYHVIGELYVEPGENRGLKYAFGR